MTGQGQLTCGRLCLSYGMVDFPGLRKYDRVDLIGNPRLGISEWNYNEVLKNDNEPVQAKH
jgi:hypothetical protein